MVQPSDQSYTLLVAVVLGADFVVLVSARPKMGVAVAAPRRSATAVVLNIILTVDWGWRVVALGLADEAERLRKQVLCRKYWVIFIQLFCGPS